MYEAVPVEQLDRKALLRERLKLLDHRRALSRSDKARLAWIRWQLDRIDFHTEGGKND